MANTDSKLMSDFPGVDYDTWRAQVERDLKGGDFDKRLVSHALEGFALQPIYTRGDWPGAADEAGQPGQSPYRRGTRPDGRTGDSWDMRQRYVHPDPAQARREIDEDLARGVTSLRLRFDSGLGTGVWVGDGIAPADMGALKTLFAGLPFGRCGVFVEAAAGHAAIVTALSAAVEASGVEKASLSGGFGCDPLGTLAGLGRLPGSQQDAEQALVTLAKQAEELGPGMRAVTVSTAAYHDAGASADQEIGLALASGLAYLRALTDGGVHIDAAASQVLFSVSIAGDFFMEMAKLRALRQAWAHVVKTCGGSEAAQAMHLQARTSLRTKTVRDPWVNMLRATTEAFSAAAGGADAIATDSFDAAIGPADGFARRIASNLQVVLNEESHVARVADPAGGSYYVEHLTDALGKGGWQVLQTVEAEGGMWQALSSGKIERLIADTAARREGLLRKRKQAITGVSEFANLAERSVERPPSPPAAPPSGDLKAMVEAAHPGPPLTCSALPVRRDADLFEALRDRSDAFLGAHGKRPQAFLANLGPIPKHKARSSFASGFLNAGGIECLDNDGFETAEAAAAAYAASGAPLVVLCGGDDQYETWVTQLVPELVAKGAKAVVLAGRGGEHEARYRDAGVSHFIYMGADVVTALSDLLTTAGATGAE